MTHAERRLVDRRARRGADHASESADARRKPERRAAAIAAARQRQRRPFDRPRGAGERLRRAEPFDRCAARGGRLRRGDEQADRRPSPVVAPRLDPQRRARAFDSPTLSASLRPGPARSTRVSWRIWSAARLRAPAPARPRIDGLARRRRRDDAGPGAFGRRPHRRQRGDADHRQRRRPCRRRDGATSPNRAAAA